MIRETDLVSYLPPFMQNYKENVVALEAENPEFLIVWKATDRVLYNHFIATADEYGISRFEKLLNIYPSSEDTLESRRSRVQSKWFSNISYTWKTLLQKLTVICSNTDFTISNNFTEGYVMTLNTNLELFGQVEELEYTINTMLPSNIVVDSKNNIPCNVKSTVLFGGGIVQTDSFMVTNDSQETVSVQGSTLFSGGIVDTVKIQITNDFNENYEMGGDVKAASGTVYVGFYEIN